MNKKLLLGLSIIILLATVQGALAFDTTNSFSYYTFDDADLSGTTVSDLSTNGNDGTNADATSGGTGLLGEAFTWDNYPTENNERVIGDGGWTNNDYVSLSFWFKPSLSYADSKTNSMMFYDTTLRWNAWIYASGVEVSAGTGSGQYKIVYNDVAPAWWSTSAWTHAVIVYSPTRLVVFMNNAVIYNDTLTSTNKGNSAVFNIGNRYAAAYNGFDGLIDEFYIFAGALTPANVSELYNSGSGYNPFDGAPPVSGVSTWTLNVTDLYDDSALEGVNVTFDTGCSNLTTASGVATVTNETTGCTGLSGTLSSVTATLTTYESNETTYSITENGTGYAGLYQGRFNVTSISTIITDTVLGPALGVWTVNTSGGKTYEECGATYPCNIYLLDGENNLTLQYTGTGDWYDKDFTVNITAPESTTGTVTELYDSVLFVNSSNAFTGALISNFTLNVSNSTEAYAESYTTTTGNVSVYTLQELQLFLFMDATGYSYANTTLFPTNTTPYYEFELYTMNSITINIYDSDSSALITENMTVVVSGNATEETDYTTTGSIYFDLLTDGEYNIKISGGNYTLRTYTVTVADRSTQVLDAYLSLSTQTVTLTTVDKDTRASLEGCSQSMSQLINSTWTVVESKNTDITGRAQFTYTPTVKYQFVTTCTDYDDKTFILDPIIFSSYTVEMIKQLSVDRETDYFAVSVSFSPEYYYNGDAGNFTITFQSPTGALQSYNYTFTTPNGSVSGSGTNSIGGSFTTAYNLTGVTYPNYVNVTYTYDSTYGSPRTFTYLYLIQGTIPDDSILSNKDNDYGLGAFEKVLIAVGMTILIGGVASLLNTVVGAVLGLMMLGFFTFIGFLPIWSVLITFTVGFFYVTRRGS